jgi:hypothetical protein
MFLGTDEIITRVRLILNEVGVNESALEGESDEQELSDMIESFIEEALRFVNLNAQREMLEADVLMTDTNTPNSIIVSSLNKTQVVKFEGITNFLRFLSAHGASWKKGVYEPIMEGTPAWDKLQNPFFTGTDEDPKVGIIKAPYVDPATGSSTVDIHLYSSYHEPSENTRATLPDTPFPPPVEYTNIRVYYMAQPEINAEEQAWRVSYLAQDGFHYYLAYLVLLALGDNRSQAVLQQALPLIGINNEQV